MDTVLHSSLVGVNVGVPQHWTFADATARASATDPLTSAAYVAGAIGLLAFQASDSTFWRLATIAPTWTQVGGSSVTADNATINFGGAGSSLQVIDSGITPAKILNGYVLVFQGPSSPDTALTRVWMDTNAQVLKFWNGESWIPTV